MKIACAGKGSLRATAIITLLLFGKVTFSVGQTTDLKTLKSLSIEELMNVEVTSVSKSPELLSEVASAIQVITYEDIRRSGATSLPEALRLVSNLQVAQLNSSAWIISARGFNTIFANKLLVLIDGRTVYTPLFGGVLWELQNVLLEDIERIEVISGPGGSLWGANAVNGVINVITKKAKDAQGLYLTAAGGLQNLERNVGARYGSHLGNNFFYKIYGQHFDRGASELLSGENDKDKWSNSQAGFRCGWYTQKDLFSIQSDIQKGARFTEPDDAGFDTQNVLARWTHTYSERSELLLQTYYDRYWRDDKAALADELETYDVDFQHRFEIDSENKLTWGIGYRYVHDEVYHRTTGAGLLPEKEKLPIYSAFIQNEMRVDNIRVTLGSKFLHNMYSGFEFQPSIRASFSIAPSHMLWTALSRAVRAPSRLDVDYRLPLPPADPIVYGTRDFKSEKLFSAELGYRGQLTRRSSLSVAVFDNSYSDVYSVEVESTTPLQLKIQNGSKAQTWGAEVSGFYQPFDIWRLRGGFTYFGKDLRAKAGRDHDPSYLSNDAKHVAVLRSMLNLPEGFELDIVARYHDYIKASFATVRVPEFVTVDARLAWVNEKFEIAVVGQNLLTPQAGSDYRDFLRGEHAEFGSNRIKRGLFARVTCRF